MKVLVTGGVGFIGSNLVKRLLKEGHEVHSLDNYSTGNTEIKGCEYFRGDITEIDTTHKDYDIIFHLAAQSRIQPSFDDPTECFRVNAQGSQVVAEWARHNNIKVVYAGSCSRWHDPYQSPYASTKHLGEEVFKMYKKTYGLDVEICRFYNVYGPNEIIEGDWASVIGIWRRQIRDGENITIVGDGEQRRDFAHVTDIVDALYKVGFSDEVHEDAWELGSGVNYSINELFQMFKERFNNIESFYLPDQAGNYRKTLRENNDALERLGWEPKDRLNNYIQNL